MGRSHLRVAVVDDEPLARQRIADLLAHEEGVEIIATADNGPDAVETIRTSHPDLVFLDVQMPGLTGLDVVRAIGAGEMPPTIFVTAYDQHALQAFDLAALDYLVKPFDDERFEQAFRRARRLVSLEETRRLHERLLTVLQGTGDHPNAMLSSGSTPEGTNVRSAAGGEPVQYLERIPVDSRGKVKFVPVGDVDFIAASGQYAELSVQGRRHLIRQTMQSLEERLDPSRFLRVHRSAIVPLDRIDALLKGAGGDYEVQLRDGTRLRVSRSRREELERRLETSR